MPSPAWGLWQLAKTGSDARRHDNAQGPGTDVNSKDGADFGNHNVATRYSATEPLDQPSGAVGVIEMMNGDVDSAIQATGLRQRVQA